MNRIQWLAFALFLVLFAVAGSEVGAQVEADASGPWLPGEPLDLETLDAPALQLLLASGDVSAEALTAAYLARIAAIDDVGPALNAVIEINPAALAIARELDQQFANGGPVGPLHGIPVLLKANIDTGDEMATSAGSLALADHHAAEDAFHVARLRQAGAVILGKTNLSEWANFRDENSSSGWSSAGGQVRNPHVLDRNPCGSSSGSGAAVAASLAPLAVGTETNGSIVCPAGANGIVGIKPTLGTVSRSGIIPIAHSQDTAGPMAKTVSGAALMLGAMVAEDTSDPGSTAYPDGIPDFRPDPGQTRLDGVRIGIFRSYYGAGAFPETEAIFDEAMTTLKSLGATLVDPIEYSPPDEVWEARYALLLHEFKHDLNAYLANQSDIPADRNTLEKLIAWNTANASEVLPVFGQDIFELAQATDGLDSRAYRDAFALSVELMRTELSAWFEENSLDALLIPVNGPAWKTDWVGGDRFSFGGTSGLAAVSGYPSVVIPAGMVRGLPINVGFVGLPFAEPQLLQFAYALEQATLARRTPAYLPSLEWAVERGVP